MVGRCWAGTSSGSVKPVPLFLSLWDHGSGGCRAFVPASGVWNTWPCPWVLPGSEPSTAIISELAVEKTELRVTNWPATQVTTCQETLSIYFPTGTVKYHAGKCTPNSRLWLRSTFYPGYTENAFTLTSGALVLGREWTPHADTRCQRTMVNQEPFPGTACVLG